MILHSMALFKFTCALYQFHRQTLPIMRIGRGQIQCFNRNGTTGKVTLEKSTCCNIMYRIEYDYIHVYIAADCQVKFALFF